jgi:hypothetical protein
MTELHGCAAHQPTPTLPVQPRQVQPAHCPAGSCSRGTAAAQHRTVKGAPAPPVSSAMSQSTPTDRTRAMNLRSSPRRLTFTCAFERRRTNSRWYASSHDGRSGGGQDAAACAGPPAGGRAGAVGSAWWPAIRAGACHGMRTRGRRSSNAHAHMHGCLRGSACLCVIVDRVGVGEDPAAVPRRRHEAAAAAGVLPLALPRQGEVGLCVDAVDLPHGGFETTGSK